MVRTHCIIIISDISHKSMKVNSSQTPPKANIHLTLTTPKQSFIPMLALNSKGPSVFPASPTTVIP